MDSTAFFCQSICMHEMYLRDVAVGTERVAPQMPTRGLDRAQ